MSSVTMADILGKRILWRSSVGPMRAGTAVHRERPSFPKLPSFTNTFGVILRFSHIFPVLSFSNCTWDPTPASYIREPTQTIDLGRFGLAGVRVMMFLNYLKLGCQWNTGLPLGLDDMREICQRKGPVSTFEEANPLGILAPKTIKGSKRV